MMDERRSRQLAQLLRDLEPAILQTLMDQMDVESQRVLQQVLLTTPDEPSSLSGDARCDDVNALMQMLEAAMGCGGTQRAPTLRSTSVPANLQDPFASIANADLVALLQHEYPQTAAVCLASLPPARAASCLACLPDSERIELLTRLRDLTLENDEIVQELRDELSADDTVPAEDAHQGLAKARAIIDRIPPALRRELWDSLSPNQAPPQLEGAGAEDLRQHFLQALQGDAGLTSLEFARVCTEQWSVLDPFVECLSVETLYRAFAGLDFPVRLAVVERLPDPVQLPLKRLAASKRPVRVSEIHDAQVEILKRALDSDSYRIAIWERNKHISVSA